MRRAKNLFIPVIERRAKHEDIIIRRGKGEFLWNKSKKDTGWYNDLCDLSQRTRIISPIASQQLRNILWDQVSGLVYARIHQFIRKSYMLRKDHDLCQKLFQEGFFIFLKAVDRWDKRRKTKFLTFLGDILNQEILNKIRLHLYHKQRDWKLENKLKVVDEFSPVTESFKDNDFEREEFFGEIRELFENYSFSDELDRDIAYTMVHGKTGDWTRLQKKSNLGIGVFYRRRAELIKKLKKYILNNSSSKSKEILFEFIEEIGVKDES